MQSNHLAGVDIHGQPYPLLRALLLDETGHLVSLNFQTLDHDVGMGHHGVCLPMNRQLLPTGDDQPQQPFEPNTHSTTTTTEREVFQQSTLHEFTRFIRDQVLLEATDNLTATVLTLVVLLAMVNVAVLLIGGGLTTRTDVSAGHSHGELPVLNQRFELP
jgi:hypothetical protein